ncbi:MAG: hypothetical protein COA65_04895 [Rhodospirillaceae bacterium]|nr:MAG: hypothetical protein COA65_04895 [Rhodospirillaceae bacterium]
MGSQQSKGLGQLCSGLCAACHAAILSLPVVAAEITGKVRVIDGGTLSFSDGPTVRLIGIDAPELSQKPWGALAKKILQDMISDALEDLSCRAEGKDRYGRILATCLIGASGDIAGGLVAQGSALTYHRYSDRYIATEEKARAADLHAYGAISTVLILSDAEMATVLEKFRTYGATYGAAADATGESDA